MVFTGTKKREGALEPLQVACARVAFRIDCTADLQNPLLKLCHPIQVSRFPRPIEIHIEVWKHVGPTVHTTVPPRYERLDQQLLRPAEQSEPGIAGESLHHLLKVDQISRTRSEERRAGRECRHAVQADR